jgi:hypothetical protein
VALEQKQIQVAVDFNRREVTFQFRGPLDIKPQVFKAPIAVLKGVAAKIMQSEAEDEMTVLIEAAQAVAQEKNIVLPDKG